MEISPQFKQDPERLMIEDKAAQALKGIASNKDLAQTVNNRLTAILEESGVGENMNATEVPVDNDAAWLANLYQKVGKLSQLCQKAVARADGLIDNYIDQDGHFIKREPENAIGKDDMLRLVDEDNKIDILAYQLDLAAFQLEFLIGDIKRLQGVQNSQE